MAVSASLVTAFVFAVVVVARVELSTSTHILKGNLTCLDCGDNAAYDLSGIVVMAHCQKLGKVITATTAKDGGFQADLPSDHECKVRLGGARNNQLYAATKDMVTGIVRVTGSSDSNDDVYDISTPLAFCRACRCRSTGSEAEKYCKAVARKFGSAKTFNLPLPPEWGMAPSSYYFPFFPIIGIP